ncbi:MAG: GH92 family glycosyl hydrolase [Bacteroidales bacterium]|nr:GH92 family glycosyl hydrolase [Bacteroidales bacterium]
MIRPGFQRKILLLLLPICMVAAITGAVHAQNAQLPASLVNPFIGTGGHGHTFPGASVPFGMVQLSPDTRLDGWDGCSAYHDSDSVIYGFSHTHLSGTGCSDYGDILIMPVTGTVNIGDYGYASPFNKNDEVASPGYYQVQLLKNKVKVELTATTRAGFHRYTYPASDQANIVFDLKHRDKVLESGMKISGVDETEGFRVSQAWASKQMIYFVAKFSKPFKSHTLYSGDQVAESQNEVDGDNIKAAFQFSTTAGEQILVKVGISGVSVEGARKNLEAEIPGWEFDSVSSMASAAWNKALGKIRVEEGTHDQHVVFYSALYHTMLQPNVYSDIDGQYRGRDLKVHKADGFDYYTVFSLWDTYRAANPLYTILEPGRVNDFVNTFLRQYDEGGMLPVWELSGNETGCMIGYHAVPVIADAWLKGIRGYDGEKALNAMKNSAEQDHLGLKYYKSKGYIPADREGESVSKTLEYAYDDWCIAMMAKALDKKDDYKNYLIRAQNYKNQFDPISGFMRAKSNETWFTPFDPAEVNFNYTEANAWQYCFYVPQDLSGLMRLLGGRDSFAKKLDDLFTADSKTTGRVQADISGLIGQYAHGNEPSHHMAYLYDYAGSPWKTQELVHRICSDFYKNTPGGLIGNEDCGQMSAWYVFSAMGFYPVTPGSGIYAIGTPIFPKVTVSLENGKFLVIRAPNVSDQNFYIQSASLNGKPFTKCYISHEEILKGGDLVFNMGPQPNKAWAVGYGGFPESYISEYPVTPVPALHQGNQTFMDSTVVALSCPYPAVKIHYTLDGSEPGLRSSIYQRPILLRKSSTLRAFAISQELRRSLPIEAQFIKIPKNRTITLKTSYAGQYSAGGDLALIDFLRGGDTFHTGAWQGYEGVDIEAFVDLGAVQPIRKLSLGCLQDQGSWIFMPSEVTWWISEDGIDYIKILTLTNDVNEHHAGAITKEFTVSLKNEKARYVKVQAKNRGVCPPWHPGAGGKAWVFADEITIE